MKKQNARHGARWLLPALAVLTAASWFGNCTVETTEYTLRSARLPESFSGLRVVQLSDLHGMQFGPGNARLLAAVERAKPDLIALTGDLADEYTELSTLPAFLTALGALAPVFYVTGNHEWVMERRQREALFALLKRCGVTRLRNEYRILTRGGERLVLAGADDPNGPADQKTPQALVREIREREGEAAYILMLTHRNDQLQNWAARGIDTVLCGHAHGGIIRLPGLGAVFGTHYDLFPDQTSGVCTQGRTQMVVSRGLGPSHRIPLRIGNRPELTVVTLVRGGMEA